jgi:hypothetical protein
MADLFWAFSLRLLLLILIDPGRYHPSFGSINLNYHAGSFIT